MGQSPPSDRDNIDTGDLNLPNCRELNIPLKSGGTPETVRDATPIRKQKKSSGADKYILRAPRAYGAMAAGTILNTTAWVELVDSLGRAIAYIRQPAGTPAEPRFRKSGSWDVAFKSKQPGNTSPAIKKTSPDPRYVANLSVQGRACLLKKGLRKPKADYVFVALSARGQSLTQPRQNLTVRGFLPVAKLADRLGRGHNLDGAERKSLSNSQNADEFEAGCNLGQMQNEPEPLPSAPKKPAATGPPQGWPGSFHQWYLYQGTGGAANDPGYGNYSNYTGYPSPDFKLDGSNPSPGTDPKRPLALPIMANTTAVHGGGLVRALVPNPLRTTKNVFSTLASFPYFDPNAGCRKFNGEGAGGVPRPTLFNASPGGPDVRTAKWHLIRMPGLIGFVPVQRDNPPFGSDPSCGFQGP